ncbi:phasin family protein [Pseudoxanthomonas sp.]|uniref:phasin family protein n=1 Tax=Pseudoxanthomonas sp. TaxID=1871049 RepID=UPI00260283CF|nr:phasin family protein [Pseudoxanthomonas sp.]WDS36606.1 MAG: phasin family protein [Pseudoxanthomonas sp.]
MATKKTAGKRNSASEPSLQQQAERLQQTLGESAQQIWLAGVGAFSRAQTQGTQLFDTLVKEGSRVEQRAGAGAGKLRDALDDTVQGARDTLGKVDQAFRANVQGALKSLEVPTRRELGALIDRIDALNDQLRKHNAPPAPETATRKTASRKAPASAPGAPARKTTAKKAAPRKAVKRAVKKAPVRASGKPGRKPAST